MQCRLFGSTFTPSGLRFSEAHLIPDLNYEFSHEGENRQEDRFMSEQVRAGIQMQRASRTVEQGHLFSIEHTDANLIFEGSITGFINNRTQAGVPPSFPAELWMLIASLRMVDKLGGQKSRGLGRCKFEPTLLKVDGNLHDAKQIDALMNNEDSVIGVELYDSDEA